MTTHDASAAHFLFEAGSFGPEDLLVADFAGRETISRPYQFELRLVSTDDAIAFEDVIDKTATLTLLRGDAEEKYHGVVVDFEAGGRVDPERVFYRAVLVPRLWRLGLTRRSRVFQNLTVQDIVNQVLKGDEIPAGDVKWDLKKKYPKREYVVQYEETDLAFVSRLLEHDGIFYVFDNLGDKETLVLSDDPHGFKTIQAPDAVPFRTAGGMAGELGESVQALSLRERLVTGKVLLRDYNYRTPSTKLEAKSEIKSGGVGLYYAYGDHFKDGDEGSRLARVRNEEIESTRTVGRGGSDCRGLRAGYKFTLEDHFRGDCNQEYVMTEVEHQGSQAQALGLPGESGPSTYVNDFVCIPASAPYRPPRVTPKPRVDGVMHAVVDSAGSGQYADIDDQGRYKVKLPFDLADAKDGEASKAMRMAQPYSGADFGMHFPLHKGTEVILSHIDGDVDRPIIAASIPNPDTGSPVKGGNKTQSMIRTGGNNQIVLEDSDGSQRITMSTPSEGTVFSMGAPNSPGPGFFSKTNANFHLQAVGNALYEIKSNWTGLITGDVTWDTQGNVNEKHLGNKTTLINGNSGEQIGGNKTEGVLGTKTELLAGLYTNITGGAKIETGLAIKVDKVAGPSLWESPVVKIHGKAAIDGKAPRVHFDGAGVASVSSGASSRVEIHPADIDIVSADVMTEGTGKLVLKGGGSTITLTSGSIELKCGGSTIKMSGGKIEVKSSDVQCVGSSGRLNLGGSASITAGDIYLKGKVTET